ncbi:arginase family protein [Stygiobacter electus]|uniref:Arginase family protein n=1 Tax=Stygiobacter electus TaxID=3032292 RepID=A0AAE3TFC2_9BACT|nr:arginase family protein [Stygiobacter electus]MDF1613278.1 arginase family protein [Stygiobacter electus]
MKEICIIKAPTNLGLKEPATGIEPGAKLFPEKLLQQNFAERINVTKIDEVISPAYQTVIDPESKVRNADLVREYSIKLSEAVKQNLSKNYFPIVIGGDCSILIGNTIALCSTGNYGLFFLDGHTDFCLPEHNLSTSAAGMDLAIVTGNGHDKLTNIFNLKPYIKEENVFCVGNREYSNGVEKIIKESKINYHSLNALRKTGIKKIVIDFLLMIDNNNLNGYWIHFDVDVMNDEIMPCVDSRAEDGLFYEELDQILKPLLKSEKAMGIDITIFDPTLDPNKKIIKEFSNKISEIIK